MSESPQQGPGAIVWADLTVPDAEKLRDFYSAVVDWRSEDVDMEGYADFSMTAAESGDVVAGICHARGLNADLPSVWMLYILVENLDTSVARCVELGGRCLVDPRRMGKDRYCVIRDPAGAVCALYQKGS